MGEIRGLTLIQPMGWALFHGLGGRPLGHGLKDVENRDQAFGAFIGQHVAIHGGKSYDLDYEDMVLDLLELDELPPEAHATGILGTVVVDRIVQGYRKFSPGPRLVVGADRRLRPAPEDPAFASPWYVGRFGHVLRDQVLFAKPVPCRGMPGFWPLPPKVLEQVRLAWKGSARG